MEPRKEGRLVAPLEPLDSLVTAQQDLLQDIVEPDLLAKLRSDLAADPREEAVAHPCGQLIEGRAIAGPGAADEGLRVHGVDHDRFHPYRFQP